LIFLHFCDYINKLNENNELIEYTFDENFRYMETLSDEEIKKGILEHLTKVMRNYKDDQEYQLPALKLIKPTRWHSDPLFLVSSCLHFDFKYFTHLLKAMAKMIEYILNIGGNYNLTLIF
jgi:hypothetical protein